MRKILILILLISWNITSYTQVAVEPRREVLRVRSLTEAPKSLITARLLSSFFPGGGQFYVNNYWKGILDLGITSGLIGGTILTLHAHKNAPAEKKEGEPSKEDYTVLAVLCGGGALGYYIFQIWRLNDDVVVYNYKKRFLESTSFRFNFTPNRYSLSLVSTFI